MTPELAKKAIAANIEALRQHLTDSAVIVSEAFQAIETGEQNQSIGAMLDLDERLEAALALYRAAVALHRTGRAP
jgi:surface antigen